MPLTLRLPPAVLRRRVIKYRLVFIAVIAYGVVYVSISAGGNIEYGSSAAKVGTCSSIFSISDARPFWESASGSPALCGSSGLSPAPAKECLTRLRARRGRPAEVFIMGDSRARLFFTTLQESLNLEWKGVTLQEQFPDVANVSKLVRGSPMRCIGGSKMSRGGKIWKVNCNLAASNEVIGVVYYWDQYVNVKYLETLDLLESSCRKGEECPDLVVLTAGKWYARPYDTYYVPLQERALKFRQDTLELAPVLRRLSTHTKVLYRPDGPRNTETHGLKPKVGGVIMTINVLGITATQRSRGAQTWTSSLADTMRFYHTVCRRWIWKDQMMPIQLRPQCSHEVHIGPALRTTAVGALFNYLCRDTAQQRPGHCCHVPQRT